MIWDPDFTQCRYICEPIPCIDGFEWIVDECKCKCLKQTCPEYLVWDNSQCLCICEGMPEVETLIDGELVIVRKCPNRMKWCEECCECIPCYDEKECPEGTFFDPETCKCLCLPLCCEPNEHFCQNAC